MYAANDPNTRRTVFIHIIRKVYYMAITLTIVSDKENALCQYLTAAGYSTATVSPVSYTENDPNLFEVNCIADEKAIGTRYAKREMEFIVLTDEEATKTATEQIEADLWAFNYDFLAKHSEIISKIPKRRWVEVQGEICEDLNPLVRTVIGEGFADLAAAAIEADGRGHFLAPYDGEEHETEYNGVTYFIYRTN